MKNQLYFIHNLGKSRECCMYRLITSVLLLTGEIIKCLLNQDMNDNDNRFVLIIFYKLVS